MAVKIISWIARIAVALMFAMTGIMKLTFNEAPQEIFAQLPGGNAAMVLAGLMELAAAVLIVIPKTKVYGGLLAAVVMFGAIGAHLAVLEDDSMLPMAIVMLIAASAVVVLHREELPLSCCCKSKDAGESAGA